MAMIEQNSQTGKYKINSNTPYGKLSESQEVIMNNFLGKVTKISQNEKYTDDEHLILFENNNDIYYFDEYQRIYPANFSEDSSTIQVINTGIGSDSIGYGNIARAVYHCYNQMSVDTFTIAHYTGDTILKEGIYKLPEYAKTSKEQLVKFLLDVTASDSLLNKLQMVESFIVMRMGNKIQYMSSSWETLFEQPTTGSFMEDCKNIIIKAYEESESKHK